MEIFKYLHVYVVLFLSACCIVIPPVYMYYILALSSVSLSFSMYTAMTSLYSPVEPSVFYIEWMNEDFYLRQPGSIKNNTNTEQLKKKLKK